MSDIIKCENCGCEEIDIVNKHKGYYVCPKCGRDTERLYEIEHDEHDKEVRVKAIDEFVKTICKKYTEEESKGNYRQYCVNIKQDIADMAEQMKASEDIHEDLKLKYCYEDLSSAENRGYMQGYNEAIDEFFSELCEVSESIRPVGWTGRYCIVTIDNAKEIAERMKAGGANE